MHWLSRLAKLNVYRAKGGPAPHKPLLLLVLLELAERGDLPGRHAETTASPAGSPLPSAPAETLLELTPELAFQFFTYWTVVAYRRTQRPDVRLPFYHLAGDGFWTPLDENRQLAPDSKRTRFARLDPEFAAQLRDPEFRQKGRRVLWTREWRVPGLWLGCVNALAQHRQHLPYFFDDELPIRDCHGVAAVRRQDVLCLRQLLPQPVIEEPDFVGDLWTDLPTAGTGNLDDGHVWQGESPPGLDARGLQRGPFGRATRLLHVHQPVHHGVAVAGEPMIGFCAGGSMDLSPLQQSVPVRSGIEQNQSARVRRELMSEDADVLRTDRAADQEEGRLQTGTPKRQSKLARDLPGVTGSRTRVGTAGSRVVVGNDSREFCQRGLQLRLQVDAVAYAVFQHDRRTSGSGNQHRELMAAGSDPASGIAVDVGIDSLARIVLLTKASTERNQRLGAESFKVKLAWQAVRAELPGRLSQQLMRWRPTEQSIAVAHHRKVRARWEAKHSNILVEHRGCDAKPGPLQGAVGRIARQGAAACA